MKNKKFISLMVGTAMLANLALFAVASAATTGTGTASSTVSAGSLAIFSVDNVTMTGTTVSPTAQTSTGSGTVHFQDFSDSGTAYKIQFKLNNDLQASSAQIVASQMTSSAEAPSLATNNIANSNYASSCSTGFSSPAASTFTASNTYKDVVTKAAGAPKITDCTYDFSLSLSVPAHQPIGTYTAVMTALSI